MDLEIRVQLESAEKSEERLGTVSRRFSGRNPACSALTERREDRCNATAGLSDSARPADAKHQPQKCGPLHPLRTRAILQVCGALIRSAGAIPAGPTKYRPPGRSGKRMLVGILTSNTR